MDSPVGIFNILNHQVGKREYCTRPQSDASAPSDTWKR
jgi:hypothetical protein